MSGLPPDDRVPDFPPGPRSPEDATPGRRFALTLWQTQTLADFSAEHRGTVELEERGNGYVLVRLLDPGGRVGAERLLPPVDPT